MLRKNKSQTQNKTNLAHLSYAHLSLLYYIYSKQGKSNINSYLYTNNTMPQQNKPMPPQAHFSLSFFLSWSNDLVHLLFHGVTCACHKTPSKIQQQQQLIYVYILCFNLLYKSWSTVHTSQDCLLILIHAFLDFFQHSWILYNNHKLSPNQSTNSL